MPLCKKFFQYNEKKQRNEKFFQCVLEFLHTANHSLHSRARMRA